MVRSSIIFALCCCSLLGLVVADLEDDLREFVALIPLNRVTLIAAKYYAFDWKFRAALRFARSPEFRETLKEMRTPLKQSNLAKYLKKNISDQDLKALRTLLKNLLRFRRIQPMDPAMNRDLSTFLHEVVRALPRQQIRTLAGRKMRESPDFARVYKVLRTREFNDLVIEATNMPALRKPLQKLTVNYIDVEEIVKVGLELLRWGPNPL